jgi:hypothetical protein
MNRRPGTPLLKKLFWLYFLLLIFEGALRKWVLPQFSAPLLLVRDPVALLIIWEAYRTHKWPRQWAAAIGFLAAALVALCFIQMIAGDNPWFVALYGLRAYLLPFPVAFIMGENLDQDDLRRFGLCTLWLLLPLTALEVAQYRAPSASILNIGASQGAKQLAYAGSHVRASATFSFVSGPTSYLPLAEAFIFYGIVDSRFAKKWLLYAASCALLIAVPVTGSRSVVVEILAVFACVGVAALFGMSQLATAMKAIVAMIIVAVVVFQLPIFSDSMRTFEERQAYASEQEGNTEGTIASRVTGPLVRPIEESLSVEHWYGEGMGLGSNAVSFLLTGQQQFLAGEGGLETVIYEFGPPFGLAFAIFRLMLAVMIAARALAKVREHQPLAWFLVPLLFILVGFGPLEQPTIQGFAVVTLGFSLAALKGFSVPDEADSALHTKASTSPHELHAWQE